MYEDEENEKTPLFKIIQNFDDVIEVPPEYQEIVAECDLQLCETFPSVKIQIACGLSTQDTMKFELIKLQEPLILRAKKNKKKAMRLASQDITAIQNQVMGGLFKESQNVNNKKLLLVKKKFNHAIRDLKILQDMYADINTHLKYLYNNFQYLITNPILNDSNKNFKLSEFLKEFYADFKKLIIQVNERQFDFTYLCQLKEEFIKFSINRYQLMVAYMIHSRKLVEVNLESLIEM
jgi:hypothetical protein